MSNKYWVESFLSSMQNMPLGDFIEMCEANEYDMGLATVQISSFIDAARLWISIKNQQEEDEKCLSRLTTLD